MFHHLKRAAYRVRNAFQPGLILPSEHFDVRNGPDGRQQVILRPEILARLKRSGRL